MYWFCHTATCLRHGCTCVPHPEPHSHLPPHTIPLVIPVHQPQASCILHRTWTGDHFLYNIIHVLMPFSQIIPTPPPPPVQVQCRIQEAWGWCTGMTRGMVRGGRWEGGSGWGTRVHPWQMHVDVWQNQYNIVK